MHTAFLTANLTMTLQSGVALRAPPISLPGHEIVINRTGFFGFWGQKPEITGLVGHKFVSGHSPDTLLGGALHYGVGRGLCPRVSKTATNLKPCVPVPKQQSNTGAAWVNLARTVLVCTSYSRTFYDKKPSVG